MLTQKPPEALKTRPEAPVRLREALHIRDYWRPTPCAATHWPETSPGIRPPKLISREKGLPIGPWALVIRSNAVRGSLGIWHV